MIIHFWKKKNMKDIGNKFDRKQCDIRQQKNVVNKNKFEFN